MQSRLSRWVRHKNGVCSEAVAVAAEVLRCPSCGTGRDFGIEHERRIRAGRAPLTPCRDCRRPRPKATEADRAWWLERLGLEECREMGMAIFG